MRLRIAGDYFRRLGVGPGSTLTVQVPSNPFTNSFTIIPTGAPKNTGPNGPEGAATLTTTFNAIADRTFNPVSRFGRGNHHELMASDGTADTVPS